MKISKRFFAVLVCFSLLFLAPIKNESLAACGADPDADSVKIAGYAYTSTSIQDAYNYASTTLSLPSFTLQLAGQIFTEDLVIDGGAVVLDGGWDCSFATKTSPSSVFGTITIIYRFTDCYDEHGGAPGRLIRPIFFRSRRGRLHFDRLLHPAAPMTATIMISLSIPEPLRFAMAWTTTATVRLTKA